ncbi:DUF6745 domain-containing protein [Saccharothrix longispora]|uniref:DUF6745 domain-containing protein n=1 Tax=Saccharothrix longispora TaxID=33920 RepID=UPI0028FD0FE9|nr:hypothetical protein [Saccharothrix longispora]MDU0291711.1 hypothetical protein [Saccharothrix longispora]
MSRRRRHRGARHEFPPPTAFPVDAERWWRAVALCDEWQRHALATAPADRPAAEAAISALYRLEGRPPPEFTWVDSPREALRLVRPGPIRNPGRDLSRDVANDIADRWSALRWRLERRLPAREWSAPLREGDALDALRAGGAPARVAESHLLGPLTALVRGRVAGFVRAELGETVGLCWYGQHEVDWIARFQVHRLLGDLPFTLEDSAELELWAVLARSCGWWWPREGRCVVSDRPVEVHLERGDDPRPHHDRGPAVLYRDGFALHAWHGTRVPAWVVGDPTPERIAAERNAEVRRCAVERLGWEGFLADAGLVLVATAPDPGNDGQRLRLYDQPPAWGARQRLLVTVNGSVERDGTHRRYGLRVPAWFDDPVDAVAWTYGLTGDQYALLVRRT